MTIIDSLKTYISQCPYLKTLDDALILYVDHSQDDKVSTYSIYETVTSNPIVKRYVDNSSIRQCLFIFSSIEFYGSDTQTNIDNCGFYENFSNWLENNSNNKILPILSEDKEARKIEALTNGYLFSNAQNGETARYTIQLKLTYFQK